MIDLAEFESKLVLSIENFESKLNYFWVLILRGFGLVLFAAMVAIFLGNLFPILLTLPKT